MQEERECTKEVIVPTPILSIWERSQRIPAPLLSAHKFVKHMNKICISKEKLKVCGLTQNGQSVSNAMENGKMVKYACISSPSVKAESSKKRAMVGESLSMELNELATSYRKPETCDGDYDGLTHIHAEGLEAPAPEIGPCRNSPCINGGRCYNEYCTRGYCSKYSCSCQLNYYGKNCQYSGSCDDISKKCGTLAN